MKKLRQTTTVKRHVLIVDDEVVNREILGNILSVKYDVEYADNAKEALEALSRQDKQFALILLDLLMPVMDGFEFLKKREASEPLKRIPVIVMTCCSPAATGLSSSTKTRPLSARRNATMFRASTPRTTSLNTSAR